MLRPMTMSFLLEDHFESPVRHSPAIRTTAATPLKGERDGVHILNEKLEIPSCAGLVERPRLIEKLERSLGRFAATLVSGRAGTGKTSIAAAYARTRKRAVLMMVLGKGLRMTAAGIVLGVLGSFVLTRFLRSLLFGVTQTDPFTFIAVPILLIVAATLACLLPALRAIRVDPMTALKCE